MPEISELLESLISRGGSDLHLSSNQRPRMRVHGDLLELEEMLAPRPDGLKERLWKVTPERNRNEFREKHDTDFAMEIPGQARFRVNLFEDREGIAAVFRQIPYEIPSFEQLGLPASSCVAIEDSRNGLLSSHAAGIPTIVTPGIYTHGQKFDEAAIVVDDLRDFDFEQLACVP